MLVHAGLLGRSRWQADEYFDFALVREFGWPLLFDRTRPWAELLLAAYGVAVNHLHRPLAGSFTLLLWAGLAAASAGPAWFSTRRLTTDRSGRLLLGLSILALCLIGHPVGEVFFWPAAAAAYLPTLAAVCLLFWCLADGLQSAWLGAAALVLAAGSSEVGLFFTFIFSAATAMLSTRRRPRDLWWLGPGAALSLGLSVSLLRGRFGIIEVASDGPYFHHVLPSLGHGAAVFAGELRTAGAVGPVSIVLHLAARLLVFLGARWCAMLEYFKRDASRHLPAFIIALVGSAFVSLAAAFYQFGALCCQRHETMREVFIMLAILSAGVWSAPSARPAPPPAAATAALLSAVLLLFLPSLPSVAEAYRQYPHALRARGLTWQSGLRAGPGDMTLVLQPDDSLIGGGDFLVPGSYALDRTTLQSTSWYTRGILSFFGKTHLTVERLPP